MDAPLLQALISGLAVGGMYALVASGFNITFTRMRAMNFSQGDFVSVGTFIGLSSTLLLQGADSLQVVTSNAEFSDWVQVLGIITATVLAGVLCIGPYLSAVRPFAGKQGVSWVMSTVGFSTILASVALTIWGPALRKLPASSGDEILRIAGAGMRPQELLMLAVAIVVIVSFDWVLRYTHTGQVKSMAFSNLKY